MYIKETCIINGEKEIEKYMQMRSYIPGECRGRKIRPTSEAQKKINQRHAKKKKERIVKANFKKGDLFLTFTYEKDKRPENRERAKADRKNLIDKIRKAAKKVGVVLKYVFFTEIGERGAVHHHLYVKRCDIDIFESVWTKGGIHIQTMYTDNMDKLAKYASGDDEYKREHNRAYDIEWWSRSRNLVVPEVIKERILARHFSKNPKPEKGYIITDLRQGINSWGYEWQSYRLVPIGKKE